MRTVTFKHWRTKEQMTALFHQWAQEADGEGQSNPVAIVEYPDGRVETVYAGHITFVEPAKPAAEGVAHQHEWEPFWSSACNGIAFRCECGAVCRDGEGSTRDQEQLVVIPQYL